MRNILFLILISTFNLAHAESAEPAGPFGSSSSLVMIGFMMVMIYLFMIRPQNKKAKEHKDLLGNLTKGDEIVTISGLLGQIEKIGEQFIILRLAEGVEVRLQKNAISATLPKGTIKSV